jgi:hypothetical protein
MGATSIKMMRNILDRFFVASSERVFDSLQPKIGTGLPESKLEAFYTVASVAVVEFPTEARRKCLRILSCVQGCQILLGTTYQNGKNIPNFHKTYQISTKHTKFPQNIPNFHKTYQISTKHTKLPQYIPNAYKVYQMAVK